jgi:hypothetical protein
MRILIYGRSSVSAEASHGHLMMDRTLAVLDFSNVFGMALVVSLFSPCALSFEGSQP